VTAFGVSFVEDGHERLAIELAAALRALNDGDRASPGWSRLLSTHPTSEQRIKGL
jgi:Zn-dependent protease with chaperone function